MTENVSTEKILKLDRLDLEKKVKEMYKLVAEHPEGKYHFKTGRSLAEELGYNKSELDNIPIESVDSFAGVGNPLSLIEFKPFWKVLDIGSGSGTDSFIAASRLNESGNVTGIDMTAEQLKKSNLLKDKYKITNVNFVESFIEKFSFEDDSFDLVISNGVLNLSPEKQQVFNEINRVLKSGGYLAISDIISEKQLSQKIKCDATLWASCIGGATQEEEYSELIENANLEIIKKEENTSYEFISKQAINASKDYGVKSASYLAKSKK